MRFAGVIGVIVLASYCHAQDVATMTYTGPRVCEACHKDIARTQRKTAMARTWRGTSAEQIGPDLPAQVSDGAKTVFTHVLRGESGELHYSVSAPQRGKLPLSLEATVGGARHGLGFLVRLNDLNGQSLARAPLIQTRYFWNFSEKRLVTAPALPVLPADSWESGLGLVLSPDFEKRCLTCHGQPNTLGAGKEGGVRCESCHGAGSEHLKAVRDNKRELGLAHAKTWSVAESLEVCGQCHAGFGRHLDPTPAELLIANQVTALRNSECFIQSGERLGCISCHNPHGDSVSDRDRSRVACQGCHSSGTQATATICPVRANGDCVQCHMPTVEVGPLRLVDHWIRVVSDSGLPAGSSKHREKPPLKLYLRRIVTGDEASAIHAAEKLRAGQSFYEVARAISKAPEADIGGYLGSITLNQLNPALREAAGRLEYGENSPIVREGDRWIIVERAARNFRLQSAQMVERANELRLKGNTNEAAKEAQQALMIYPNSLRALTSLGTTLAENGALRRAEVVFQIATRLYPEDAESFSMLGFVEGALGKHEEEVRAYRKAIELEPDFVQAYGKLADALGAREDWRGAAEVIRKGLLIDPLSAELYSQLSLTWRQLNDIEKSQAAKRLANDLQPGILQ